MRTEEERTTGARPDTEAGGGALIESTAPSAEPLPRNAPQRPWSGARAVRLLLMLAVPLLLGFVVLQTGYDNATHRRYDWANGVAGELVDGGSVGQTFVSRYDDLSGVEILLGTYARHADPTRAPIVMHLRADPSSTTDLATGRIDPSELLVENGWYLFSFPPIPDSAGKRYYVQVEAPGAEPGHSLTVYWFQPSPTGNAYVDGAAYLNGDLTPGDLSFGLQYTASPLQVWGTVLREASANTSTPALVLVLIVAVAGIAWGLFWLPGRLRDPERRRQWLLRWSLPTVLAASLVYSLLFLLTVPPWQGPDEQSHYAYIAVLDRHGLDDRVVPSLQLQTTQPDNDIIRTLNASTDRHEFSRLVVRSGTPGAPTNLDPGSLFQQVRQPAPYYWLSAAGLRIARAIGIPANPSTNPDTSILVMRSVSMTLGLVVVALAWVCAAMLGGKRHPWLRLALPLTVALLPMHTFVATIVNNDILAEVAVAALFTALVALLRTPYGLKGATLATLCVILTAASAATKSTALAASVPLLAGGLLVWVGMLLARGLPGVRGPSSVMGQAVVVSAAVLLGELLLIGGVLLAFQRQEDHALGWFNSYDTLERAPRVRTDTAREGTYAIELGGQGESTSAVQDIVPMVPHPTLNITFTGWARIAPGAALTGTEPIVARLAFDGGYREAARAEVALPPNGEWVPIEVKGRVFVDGGRVRLRLENAGAPAPVQFDTLYAGVQGSDKPWNDPFWKPQLINGSGEEAAITVHPLLARVLPQEVERTADALSNPLPLDRYALWRSYAYLQNRSYWGSFAWLSINLPAAFFTALGWFVVAALVGLVVRVIRKRRWTWRAWLALVSLVALAAAIFTGFAKQMMLTAYGGLPAFPQGRYLFVLTIPAMWLLLTGLAELWTSAHLLTNKPLRRNATHNPEQPPTLNRTYALWLLATTLIFVATFSLFGLIIPYYHSN